MMIFTFGLPPRGSSRRWEGRAPALEEAGKSQDPEIHAQAEDILAELNRPPVDDSPVPQAAKGAMGMQSCASTVSNAA